MNLVLSHRTVTSTLSEQMRPSDGHVAADLGLGMQQVSASNDGEPNMTYSNMVTEQDCDQPYASNKVIGIRTGSSALKIKQNAQRNTSNDRKTSIDGDSNNGSPMTRIAGFTNGGGSSSSNPFYQP